jgi:hypothetical protein
MGSIYSYIPLCFHCSLLPVVHSIRMSIRFCLLSFAEKHFLQNRLPQANLHAHPVRHGLCSMQVVSVQLLQCFFLLCVRVNLFTKQCRLIDIKNCLFLAITFVLDIQFRLFPLRHPKVFSQPFRPSHFH